MQALPTCSCIATLLAVHDSHLHRGMCAWARFVANVAEGTASTHRYCATIVHDSGTIQVSPGAYRGVKDDLVVPQPVQVQQKERGRAQPALLFAPT